MNGPPPAPPTDAALLAQARGGDRAALAAVLDRYETPLFHYLRGVLRDRHAAEDALQETFVVAVRRSADADPATFRGWLFAVAHQQAMLWKRKAKRLPAAASDEAWRRVVAPDADPHVAAGRAEESALVAALLAALPENQRAVIRLRLFDGLKFRDVAERLGCPLNTALSRMRDGLHALRTHWETRHAEG